MSARGRLVGWRIWWRCSPWATSWRASPAPGGSPAAGLSTPGWAARAGSTTTWRSGCCAGTWTRSRRTCAPRAGAWSGSRPGRTAGRGPGCRWPPARAWPGPTSNCGRGGRRRAPPTPAGRPPGLGPPPPASSSSSSTTSRTTTRTGGGCRAATRQWRCRSRRWWWGRRCGCRCWRRRCSSSTRPSTTGPRTSTTSGERSRGSRRRSGRGSRRPSASITPPTPGSPPWPARGRHPGTQAGSARPGRGPSPGAGAGVGAAPCG